MADLALCYKYVSFFYSFTYLVNIDLTVSMLVHLANQTYLTVNFFNFASLNANTYVH